MAKNELIRSVGFNISIGWANIFNTFSPQLYVSPLSKSKFV